MNTVWCLSLMRLDSEPLTHTEERTVKNFGWSSNIHSKKGQSISHPKCNINLINRSVKTAKNK
jgi:hypothetical protein